MPPPARNKLFISYSHKEKRWRDELEIQLKPYLRGGSITSWSDEQIVAGSQWFGEIKSALTQTTVAVLLVSPDYIASDFIHEHELGPLLKEAEQGGAKILWVPVRDSAYRRTPLKNYQAVLSPETPLAAMPRARRDQAWVRICEEIERALKGPREPQALSVSQPHSDTPHVAGQDQAEDDVPKVGLFPNPALRIQRPETEQRQREEKEQLEAELRETETNERLEPERRQKQEQANRFLEKATTEEPWQNSLGMRFVPVAETQVSFSIWDTRVADFRAFVDSTGYDATGGVWSVREDGWDQRGATWREPGFQQSPTDPIVGVSWDDAKAFCGWLTKRERCSGALPVLPEGMYYRLPTDQEWSIAVGLDPEPGNTPQEKDQKIKLYPWGKEWPPPSGTGNYCGEESRIGNEPQGWPVIEGYNDGYPRTSPVGSFGPNKNGLYDIGGNVWQWCEDWYNSENQHRVMRGASWDVNKPAFLLASYRSHDEPVARGICIGFRCVVARAAPQEMAMNRL
jgi:formylglycine-generating enzyme required for sulfatase activity